MNSPARQYRYYEFVMAAFVTVLICSNLIGPAKIWQFDFPLIGEVTPGAGVLFFPISYVFGDILTEVYGYARSRRVIWAGFAGLAFAALMAWIVVRLPPAPFWENQAAYEIAFGSTWRIAAASLIGFLCGEFVNSFVLAKLDDLRRRRRFADLLSARVLGERADSGRKAASDHAGPVRLQGRDRGGAHPVDLRRRRVAEARRAGGLLRQAHGLQSFYTEDLRLFRRQLKSSELHLFVAIRRSHVAA